MAVVGDVSKIKDSAGNLWQIKDEIARSQIGGAIIIRGTTTTALTDEATTNPIQINGESYTAVANDAVFYSKKEFVFDGTKWHEFGDMSNLGDFAYVDTGTVTIKPKGTNSSSSVTFAAHTTDKVLGEDTTFTNSTSAVSFGTPTKDTFAKTVEVTTQPTVTLNASSSTSTDAVTYVQKISTSGTYAVKFATEDHTADAITSLGTASTDTFVKSYPGTTSKLTTTTVTGVSGSTTASKATAGTAVSVAKTGTAVTVATGLGSESTSRTASSVMFGATVDSETETLSFTFKPITTTSVTPAASNGTITPYTFTDVTVPKAATSATTVATGAVAANSSGATVMTGLGTATTAAAVTGYASPTTATVLKSDVTATVPKTAATTRYLTATASDTAVGVATSGDAITDLPSATAAAQTITVGTNDKVTAIKALGAATAAAQEFNGTQESYTVYPAS